MKTFTQKTFNQKIFTGKMSKKLIHMPRITQLITKRQTMYILTQDPMT